MQILAASRSKLFALQRYQNTLGRASVCKKRLVKKTSLQQQRNSNSSVLIQCRSMNLSQTDLKKPIDSNVKCLKIHYLRNDNDYEGCEFLIKDKLDFNISASPKLIFDKIQNGKLSQTPKTVTWQINYPIDEQQIIINFEITKNDQISVISQFVVDQFDDEIWVTDGQNRCARSLEEVQRPAGDAQCAKAHWVDQNTILLKLDQINNEKNIENIGEFYLCGSTEGGLKISDLQLNNNGNNTIFSYQLETIEKLEVPEKVFKKFPHLRGFTAFKFQPQTDEKQQIKLIDELIKTQLVIYNEKIGMTGVQIQGILDQIYSYNGPLGYNNDTIMVWAPTATKVDLLWWDKQNLDNSPCPQKLPMKKSDKNNGVWEIFMGEDADAYGTYYKYEVTVFSPWSQCMQCTQVTDPYSRFLTPDGEHSIIMDIDDANSVPENWESHQRPQKIEHPTDISIYELHIRDFSAADTSVPEDLRGKYSAFGACPETNGIKYLKKLKQAGITHIHLLPSYDFGSSPEKKSDQLTAPPDLDKYPSDSEKQQEEILKIADQDAFQWGYDPVHYGVPEGSYAVNPNGADRVKEYRQMVKSLHELGFHVVLDMVYNHTYGSGTNKYSILDKIVPGYYHRRESTGEMCHSTCCNNTASEHFMCERLIIDDICHWAQNYKIDSFRFDIMGHLMLSTMKKIQGKLPGVYLYGEGWDFGEVRGNLRGQNASQLNLKGSGIGTFSDRLRDGVLGGGPFSSSDLQGFVSGLFYEPNSNPEQGDLIEQKKLLKQQIEWIKVGLIGNIRDFPMYKDGENVVYAKNVMFHGQPAGYCEFPHECVNFVSCHDNHTLFDNLILKPKFETSIEERILRVQVAFAIVCVSQGVAFFHAGDDLLRSKSLDRDSYNSGDWFNKLDWSGQTNNFGVGLPVATKNYGNWAFFKALLARNDLKPTPEQIQQSSGFFQTMLKIRYSSPLFRLRTGKQVCEQVAFLEHEEVGVIAMKLNGDGENIDENYQQIVVVINVSLDSQKLDVANKFLVHPLLEEFFEKQRAMLPCTVESLASGGTVLMVPPTSVGIFVLPRE